jgi:hypothetical protein
MGSPRVTIAKQQPNNRLHLTAGAGELSGLAVSNLAPRVKRSGLIKNIYVGPSDSEDDYAASDSGCHWGLCIFPQHQGTLSAVPSLVWNNIGAAFGSSDSSFA